MRKIIGSIAAISAVAFLPIQDAAAVAGEPQVPLNVAHGKKVTDEYIFEVHKKLDPANVARQLGVTAKHVYRGAFKGFSTSVNSSRLSALRSKVKDIKSITESQYFTVGGVKEEQASLTQNGPSWGLDRIDQRYRPLNGKYTYSQQAASVRAYVIDSGIDTDHPEFGGRALNVYSSSGGSANDCQGHGTHVAGIIGSAKYGVAKSIKLRGVKVTTGCDVDATSASVLAGIDYVYNYGIAPAVVNMSFAGSFDLNVNLAVTNLVNAGFFVAAAGGNDGEDACTMSPASAVGVTGVAGSNSTDQHANDAFLNSAYGFCVDIYAPGRAITSTYKNSASSPNAAATISGTSQATPFVCGVAAILQANNPNYTPQNIQDWITGNGTHQALSNVPWGTPNILLHKGTL
ncbi:S8 family peptidase [Streptomyces djakartensis]|uniref:S8 family peptidase n=1 Tax=Streptomyces djakartensis TaxID=68193 RepID=UPI0034DEA443